MVIGGRAHTYHQLGSQVAGIWEQLADLPVEETRVGVMAYDHLATYGAVFATMLTGRAYVPLNPAHPPSRNRNILKQAELRTVCSAVGDATSCAEAIGSDSATVIPVSSCKSDRAVTPTDVSMDSSAYLLFTSGSSGEPKGVPITFGNVDAFLRAFFASSGGMTQEDRALQMFDLTFDFSVVAFMAPLVRGACVYTIPPNVIKFMSIASLLEEEQLTQLPLVPSVLSHLRPYFPRCTSQRCSTRFSAAKLFTQTCWRSGRRWSRIPRLTNYYGPTEATVFAMYYRWDPATNVHPLHHNGIVSIGEAMEGMQALVVDEDDTTNR